MRGATLLNFRRPAAILAAVACLAGVLGVPASACAHQATQDGSTYGVELSSREQLRWALLAISVADAAGEASRAVLTAAGGDTPRGVWRGRLLRALWLYFVDLPLASLTQVLNHEAGHLSRVHERGGQGDLVVERWPWPVPLTGARLDINAATLDLGVIGAGTESSQLLADETLWRQAGRSSTPLAVALYVYSRVDSTAYTLRELGRPGRLHTPDFFESGAGDPRLYTGQLALRDDGLASEDELRGLARKARRGAILNLVDTHLWLAVADLWSAVMRGGASDPTRRWPRLGLFRVAPAIRYTPSPLGPELSFAMHVLTPQRGGTVYYRRIKDTHATPLDGVGVTVRPTNPAGRIAWRAAADVWREHGSLAARLEGGVVLVVPRLKGTSVTAASGWKSRGYLAGFPLPSGPYLLFGASSRLR